MSKDEFINADGVVIEVLPNALFRIELDSGHKILGHLSGKMRTNNINVRLLDRVSIEISPYDLTKGRIIYRFKVASTTR